MLSSFCAHAAAQTSALPWHFQSAPKPHLSGDGKGAARMLSAHIVRLGVHAQNGGARCRGPAEGKGKNVWIANLDGKHAKNAVDD